MMALRIVQVGVAPTGFGTAWLNALQMSAEWELAGVVDIVADNRSAAAERTGLSPTRCFSSIAAAAQAVEFDACAVTVPSPRHAAVCAEALEAGKHVVVEKPFATDFAEALRITALAEARGLRLMVDQNYRYMPHLRALRRAVQGQAAGRPTFVSLSFTYDWPARTYQAAMAQTMLLEMAIHHFDALRFVLDTDPRTAAGHTWRPPWTGYQGDTWVSCLFTFPAEVHVAYTGSLEARGRRTPWEGVWRIECEHGALHLDDRGAGSELYVSRFPDTAEVLESFGPPADPGAALGGTLQEFAAALREGRRPQSDGRDNLRTLAMAFAVNRSSLEGRTVDLEEFFADAPVPPSESDNAPSRA